MLVKLFPQIDIQLLMPILIVIFTGVAVLLYDVLIAGKKKYPLLLISLIGITIAAIYSTLLWNLSFSSFSNMLISDNFSVIFSVLFLLSSAIVLLISYPYLNDGKINVGEYYALILFATSGMMFMASTLNLIVLYLGLELLTLPLCILTCFKKEQHSSHEASLKFFLLSAFSSAFFLFGIAFMFGGAGTVNLAEIAKFIATKSFVSVPYILISVGLLIVGFGFKISAVPFHIWVPDVYQGAPTPITAFIAVGAKAAGFAALIRTLFFAFPGLYQNLTGIFLGFAILTMTIGNIVAISQSNIKRMLAYSSIAHSGYILVALTTFNPASISAAIFYLFIYAMANLGAFGIVLVLRKKEKEYLEIQHYAGLGEKNPLLAILMAIFMLSLAGVPPTAGFMGKFYLFSVAVDGGFVGLVIVGVLNSVISAYYYLRIVYLMYMEKEKTSIPKTFSPYITFSIIILALGIIYLGVFPSLLFSISKNAIFIPGMMQTH